MWPKSKVSTYLSNCLPTPPALLRLCRRNPSSVFHAAWGVALWLDLSSLPSPAVAVSNRCHMKNSPERICILGRILVADWPGESTLPQGSPTNGDSAAWLIGRGQVAPQHFSFFCFIQQPLHCLFLFSSSSPVLFLSLWERSVGLASGPHLQTALSPSECTLD